MYDDGLNGRFCSECFDEVVDAEEFLESEGLVASNFASDAGVYWAEK